MKKRILFSILCALSLNSYSEMTATDVERKRQDIVAEMAEIKKGNMMKGILGSNSERIALGSQNSSSYYKQFTKECRTNFKVDDKGAVESILSKEFLGVPFFKEVMISQHEEPFFIDFYSRYLIAACQFGEYKAPIHLSNNKKANEALNLLYGHVDSSYGPSINNLLQENYANALAAIQLIIKYGPRDEVLNTLRKASALTDMQYTLWTLNGYFRILTGTSIKTLLLPENLKKINRISQNDSEKMEILALEIANISTVYDMGGLSDALKEYFYSIDNLNLMVAMKTYTLIKKTMPEYFPQEDILDPKGVNSYIDVMPQKTLERLRLNGQLGGIQRGFQDLYAIKDNPDNFNKSKEALEKKIKDIIFKTMEENRDFVSWSIAHKRELSNEFLKELYSYNIQISRLENKRKISPDELTQFALPELKIYKGLIEGKVSVDFYKSYKLIESRIALESSIDKSNLIIKYR